MTTVQAEVFEAFRGLGVTEEQAMKAATALAKRDDVVVRFQARLMRVEWITGFTLAGVGAICAKLFLH